VSDIQPTSIQYIVGSERCSLHQYNTTDLSFESVRDDIRDEVFGSRPGDDVVLPPVDTHINQYNS